MTRAKPDIIDLRPNREFIDPQFSGYKLSLALMQTYTENNKDKPLKVCPQNSGYKETKLFSLHNHLFTETYGDESSAYYIDASYKIQKLDFDLVSGGFNKYSTWEIPHTHKPTYNPTLYLVSANLAVLADGSQTIYILETGYRKDNNTWRLLNKIDVDCVTTLKHCRIIGAKLHCLLYNITDNVSHIIWLKVTLSSGEFEMQKLNSTGDLYFAQVLEGDAILVSGEKTFFPKSEPDDVEIKYKWSQTGENVSVEFRVGSEVIIKDGQIKLVDKNDVFIEGKLGGSYDEDSIQIETNGERGVIHLNLLKNPTGVKWVDFIEDCLLGEYEANESEIVDANNKLEKFTNENEIHSAASIINNPEIEECDFPENENSVIERITPTGLTHRSNLGSAKYLFSVKDTVVLQQEEDANLWENVYDANVWELKHVASLTAMGYIQASKQRKKIMTCSPNHDYVVISESHCHVFVYRQNHSIAGELRNRKCGKTVQQLAQQFVLNLGQDEILGVSATNHVLYIITEKQIFGCVIN